jgi:hypothetical protein
MSGNEAIHEPVPLCPHVSALAHGCGGISGGGRVGIQGEGIIGGRFMSLASPDVSPLGKLADGKNGRGEGSGYVRRLPLLPDTCSIRDGRPGIRRGVGKDEQVARNQSSISRSGGQAKQCSVSSVWPLETSCGQKMAIQETNEQRRAGGRPGPFVRGGETGMRFRVRRPVWPSAHPPSRGTRRRLGRKRADARRSTQRLYRAACVTARR